MPGHRSVRHASASPPASTASPLPSGDRGVGEWAGGSVGGGEAVDAGGVADAWRTDLWPGIRRLEAARLHQGDCDAGDRRGGAGRADRVEYFGGSPAAASLSCERRFGADGWIEGRAMDYDGKLDGQSPDDRRGDRGCAVCYGGAGWAAVLGI